MKLYLIQIKPLGSKAFKRISIEADEETAKAVLEDALQAPRYLCGEGRIQCVERPLTPADVQYDKLYKGGKRGNNYDRRVIYRGMSTVQYNSLSVPIGAKYPTVSVYEFLLWADSVVEEP